MSNQPPPIQFDRAEYVAPAAKTCAACGRVPQGVYYTANNKIICASCHDAFLASTTGGSAALRFACALLFGLGAGVAGAILWFAVWTFLHMHIGLIAIVVGYLVGTAVRKGAANRGGVPYQTLAVLLTYTSVVSTYIPEMYASVSDGRPVPSSVLFQIIVIAFEAPIRAGTSNIIGLLIIAFALWEAWKINRKRGIAFTGPHAITPSLMATP